MICKRRAPALQANTGVVGLVASYCRYDFLVNTVRLVCRDWKRRLDAATVVIPTEFQESDIEERAAMWRILNPTTVKHLTLELYQPALIVELLSNFPSLETCVLWCLPDIDLRDKKHLRVLRVLNSGADMGTPIGFPRSLEHLHIAWMPPTWPNELLKDIHTLVLGRAFASECQKLRQIADMPNIRALNAVCHLDCPDKDNVYFLRTLTYFPAASCLNLSINLLDVQDLMQHECIAPMLDVVKILVAKRYYGMIPHYDGLKENELRWLACCPRLRHLTLTTQAPLTPVRLCTDLTSEPSAAWWPALEILTLKPQGELPETMLWMFADRVNNMKDDELRVTPPCLLPFFRLAPKLVTVEITHLSETDEPDSAAVELAHVKQVTMSASNMWISLPKLESLTYKWADFFYLQAVSFATLHTARLQLDRLDLSDFLTWLRTLQNLRVLEVLVAENPMHEWSGLDAEDVPERSLTIATVPRGSRLCYCFRNYFADFEHIASSDVDFFGESCHQASDQ